MEYSNYKDISPALTYSQALKGVGVSYIGAVAMSAKLSKSYAKGTATYGIYLAPWTMARDASGFADVPNVCGGGEHCHKSCLNESGRSKIEALANGSEHSKSNIARIRKTILFYQNNAVFMRCVLHEMRCAMKKAEKEGFEFSVRLNCTSDISPERFIDPESGRNILELFPNVQFYDYTKIPSRIALTKKYPNYCLTFSFDGYNWESAEKCLKENVNVAVVFYSAKKALPKTFNGYEVIDGNLTDIRYNDKRGTIVGLHYHPVANDYHNHTFVAPKTPFVILEGDERAEW